MDNLSFEEIKSKFSSNKKFKIASYALGGLILLALLYFLYRQFIWMPSNEKSNDSWWVGQNFIAKDSTNQAIKALEPVVKKYDGKSGGEISQFLLARQYMEKGQFQKAIKNLEGVDVNDTYIRIYSIGLQLWQDSLIKHLPRLLRYPIILFFQTLIFHFELLIAYLAICQISTHTCPIQWLL